MLIYVDLLSDVCAGFTAAILACPLVSAVDRAVAEHAATKNSSLPQLFFRSLQNTIQHPLQYARSTEFLFVWLLIGGTFATVNSLETLEAHAGQSKLGKAAVVTGVNTGLAILKDAKFAAAFKAGPPAAIPLASYAAWLGRDLIGMGLIFQAPRVLASTKEGGIVKQLGSTNLRTASIDQERFLAASIVIPFAVQVIVTPLHLLGYSFYNSPSMKPIERFRQVMGNGKDLGAAVGLRMLRQGPAFSLGTLCNHHLRDRLHAATGQLGTLAPGGAARGPGSL